MRGHTRTQAELYRQWGTQERPGSNRLETRIYLADRAVIERETPLSEPHPAEPAERAAYALARSAAEPLALDQHRQQRDATIRLAAREQGYLACQRERARARITRAREELRHVPWWNRGSRAELAAEVALQRQIVERADDKHEQLRQLAERRSRALALMLKREKVTAALRPELPARRIEHEHGRPPLEL